jgi:prevent-host-death family protein
MPHTWQLQEAKARLSELVKRARDDGPQTITVHGQERAVVLSIEEYRRMRAGKPNFRDFLMTAPVLDDETIAIINDRSKDTGRDIDLD